MAKAKAFGAVFQRYNGTIWVNVGQVLSIGELTIADKGIVDATTHDSTSGYREKISTVIDLPSFDVVILFDPADTHHEYFRSLCNNVGSAAEAFRIQLADSGSTKWEFTCIGKTFTVNSQEVDGLLQATITFEPTGAPDYSPS